jgi:Uma2 family endonuclease
MTMPPDHLRFTVEEYLRRERDSLDKHEYRNGEIVMMAGAAGFTA